MNRFLLGILVGLVLAAVFHAQPVDAQQTIRVFGTLSGAAKAIAASSGGALSVIAQ